MESNPMLNVYTGPMTEDEFLLISELLNVSVEDMLLVEEDELSEGVFSRLGKLWGKVQAKLPSKAIQARGAKTPQNVQMTRAELIAKAREQLRSQLVPEMRSRGSAFAKGDEGELARQQSWVRRKQAAGSGRKLPDIPGVTGAFRSGQEKLRSAASAASAARAAQDAGAEKSFFAEPPSKPAPWSGPYPESLKMSPGDAKAMFARGRRSETPKAPEEKKDPLRGYKKMMVQAKGGPTPATQALLKRAGIKGDWASHFDPNESYKPFYGPRVSVLAEALLR